MASIGALLQGPGGLVLPSQKSHAKLARRCRFNKAHSRAARKAGKSLLSVKAIAAPEKPSAGEKPFTAWDTAIERVAKRTDLKTIMILGAGPIVIGQVRRHPSLGG